MPFQPGQSGNANGRPKGARNKRTVEAEAYFRRILERPEFQQQIEAVLHAPAPNLAFMQTVWAYVYGKPLDAKQIIELTKVDEHGNRTTQVLEI